VPSKQPHPSVYRPSSVKLVNTIKQIKLKKLIILMMKQYPFLLIDNESDDPDASEQPTEVIFVQYMVHII